MRILICSDGTDPADNPTRLGGLIAGPCHSQTTLLGIVEKPERRRAAPARARERSSDAPTNRSVSPEIVVRSGEPIRQILAETTANEYDLAIIGARRKGERRTVLATGKNLRGDQGGSAAGAGRDRRL